MKNKNILPDWFTRLSKPDREINRNLQYII
jgi:hypothetical protein